MAVRLSDHVCRARAMYCLDTFVPFDEQRGARVSSAVAWPKVKRAKSGKTARVSAEASKKAISVVANI